MIHLSASATILHVSIPVSEAHICGKCKLVTGSDECPICGKATLAWTDYLVRERDAAGVTATTQVVGHEAKKTNGN